MNIATFLRTLFYRTPPVTASVARVDDILIRERDHKKLLKTLRNVFIVLKGNGLRLKQEYELKAFLGMMNFFHRFLDKLFTTLEPLHELLRKGQSWVWNNTQQEALEKA